MLRDVIRSDGTAERVVPASGFTAILTILSSAAMSFLAVLALALALAAGATLAKRRDHPNDPPHLIYLPEVAFETNKFLDDVAEGRGCGAGKAAEILDAGVAIELVHTSSLVLDDLPSMDNATQRRGKPHPAGQQRNPETDAERPEQRRARRQDGEPS